MNSSTPTNVKTKAENLHFEHQIQWVFQWNDNNNNEKKNVSSTFLSSNKKAVEIPGGARLAFLQWAFLVNPAFCRVLRTE